jgi:hypothetical protein
MAFISCIALLSINFINDYCDKIEEKTSRIIIKSTENQYIPDNRVHTENKEIRVAVPVTNGKSGVQLLPVPDANSPIIVRPLS